MTTSSRPVRILNLDEIMSQTPEAKVTWKGQDYPIADMSVDTYLRYAERETALAEAMSGEENTVVQMKLYLDMFELMVPGLPVDEIRSAPIEVVRALVEFVMSTVSEKVTAAGLDVSAPGGVTNEAGE